MRDLRFAQDDGWIGYSNLFGGRILDSSKGSVGLPQSRLKSCQVGLNSTNELNFLDAEPAFDLLFAGYGLHDAFEAFVIDELVDLVAAGE